MDPGLDLSSYAKDENGLFLVLDLPAGTVLHLTEEEIIKWRKDYL